ncbi:hypothetical protein QZH41_017094 [Actinostola sp. cb2023]|nr:hypothetical protein QZH41_017094 [Actinostola sp. cb2023]
MDQSNTIIHCLILTANEIAKISGFPMASDKTKRGVGSGINTNQGNEYLPRLIELARVLSWWQLRLKQVHGSVCRDVQTRITSPIRRSNHIANSLFSPQKTRSATHHTQTKTVPTTIPEENPSFKTNRNNNPLRPTLEIKVTTGSQGGTNQSQLNEIPVSPNKQPRLSLQCTPSTPTRRPSSFPYPITSPRTPQRIANQQYVTSPAYDVT